jgi:hypothetical protein
MSRNMIMIMGLLIAVGYYIGAAEALPIKQISVGGVLTGSSDYIDRSWGTGITAGIGSYLKIKKGLFITGDLNYYRLALKSDLTSNENSIYDIDGGATNIIDITINFKARLYPAGFKNTPYILMGGGVMYKSQGAIYEGSHADGLVQKSDNELCPLYDFGFGFDLTSRNNKGLYIEAKYVFGFFEDNRTGFFPIKIGLLF